MKMENRIRLGYKILCANMGVLPLPDVFPIGKIMEAYKGLRAIYDRDMEKQRIKLIALKKTRIIIPRFEKA